MIIYCTRVLNSLLGIVVRTICLLYSCKSTQWLNCNCDNDTVSVRCVVVKQQCSVVMLRACTKCDVLVAFSPIFVVWRSRRDVFYLQFNCIRKKHFNCSNTSSLVKITCESHSHLRTVVIV